MKIGIDARSLMDQKYSGVNYYAFNLLNALFKIDLENEYFLFYNGFGKLHTPNASNRGELAKIVPPSVRGGRGIFGKNVKVCKYGIPNKIFNASVTFLNWPKIDKLVGVISPPPHPPLGKGGSLQEMYHC
ncbi:hypothetical protein ACFL23_04210 [Patescibacteria group bacterium]